MKIAKSQSRFIVTDWEEKKEDREEEEEREEEEKEEEEDAEEVYYCHPGLRHRRSDPIDESIFGGAGSLLQTLH